MHQWGPIKDDKSITSHLQQSWQTSRCVGIAGSVQEFCLWAYMLMLVKQTLVRYKLTSRQHACKPSFRSNTLQRFDWPEAAMQLLDDQAAVW